LVLLGASNESENVNRLALERKPYLLQKVVLVVNLDVVQQSLKDL
jgi:hypothetical protein